VTKQVIKFSATWCGPCKIVAPMFEAMAPDFPNLTFRSIDIETEDANERALIEKLSVMSVPTIALLDGEEVVTQGSGINGINALREDIAKLNEGGR
jgi:thiol-disulfide isomerase/thioredoxin